MPPKRKNHYRIEYEKEFQGIKISKTGDDFAYCIPCKTDICLSSTGKTAIQLHQGTEKHKKAVKAANMTKSISAFMPSTSTPTGMDRQVAAAEGTFAYHIATHAQSFKSADCFSTLISKICPDSKIAGRFSSARDKTAAIITGVLAPYSVESTLSAMKTLPFSISIDSSNHKTTKLFPLVLRYFSSKNGIQVKLLDLEELGGETALEVYEWIIKILKKHELKLENLIAFCGDNVNTNFGGPEQAGERNVFHKLRTHRGNLIPIGCPSHVLHNSARIGADNLPIDIESIVFKLTSHFRNSTKRIERFKEICEDLEASFTALNSHGPTRWTTLQLIVSKILKLWEIFSIYFSPDGPLVLRNFFASEMAKTVVTFLSVMLPIFNHSIDVLQRKNAILPELIEEMNLFKNKIKERHEAKFYGIITAQMLRRLPEAESELVRKGFQDFLGKTIEYVNKWFRIERFPTELDWISLREKEVLRSDVISLAEQIAPELDDNQIFDEITLLNELLPKIPDSTFQAMSSEEKWMKIFEAHLPNLEVLVGKILSIPVSNSCVERVFSLCTAQWTDSRNLLKVKTVKSLAQIKLNYAHTCSQFYELLISTPKLLKLIVSGEKYDF